jgi:hypothetical protein
MIDKLLPLIPTQAVGIVLAFLAIWWIEPATPYGMLVLGVLVLALANAVKQVWDWLLPKFQPPEGPGKPKPAKPAPAKPKHKRAH